MATAQVLPKELRLSAPPTMPQARSYLFKQQSVLSVYEPGNNNVVTINIPRLQRSYLTKDSYLKFRIGFTWKNITGGVAAPCFDTPGAFGLFDRIEVYDYLGSTLLESTTGQAQLMALLMDTQSSSEELGFHWNTGAGTKGGKVVADKDTGLGTAYTGNGSYKIIGSNSGTTFNKLSDNPINGNALNSGDSPSYYEFTIPLFSFLGLLSQKFAPLHNGYTINLTLNSAATVFGFGTPTDVAADIVKATEIPPRTYQLNNVFLCCQILELGPVAESMLISSTQGQPFVVPSKAYRNYVGTVSKGSSNYRLDLNLNVASLTNILWFMRSSSYLNDSRWRCLSYRIRNFLQSWYFQYGSTVLPQTSGIQCGEPAGVILDENRGGFVEAYAELMKARHCLNAANFNTNITARNFWIDSPHTQCIQEFKDPGTFDSATGKWTKQDQVMVLSADSTFSTGKFAAGLDLELVSGRSNDLVCGMNTNGMNTSINLTFDSHKTADVQEARLDCWCEYDSFINVSPGIATTVSF